MKKILFILILLTALGCSKEKASVVSASSDMHINAMTKSPASFGANNPVFLFWLDSDFGAIGTDNSAQPYFVAFPYQDIDAYNTKTYDTGKKYPENDRIVCCTGYYPATLISNDTWSALTIPEDEAGLTDIMVVSKHITGQESAHFEKKSPKEPLVFIHAQSKVNFKAKMSSEMAKNRYLRNVKVTVAGKDQVLTSLKWGNGRYVADQVSNDETYKIELQDPNSAQLDPNEINMRDIGSVYLRPELGKITFDLEVEMSNSVTFDTYETIRTSEPMTISFESGGSAISLGEGDEYDINITILYDTFIVTGNKAKWQDGGKIPLPFYPTK